MVRRGHVEAEIWLDEDDASFIRSRLDAHAERLVLALVREKLDELLMWWRAVIIVMAGNPATSPGITGTLDRVFVPRILECIAVRR